MEKRLICKSTLAHSRENHSICSLNQAELIEFFQSLRPFEVFHFHLKWFSLSLAARAMLSCSWSCLRFCFSLAVYPRQLLHSLLLFSISFFFHQHFSTVFHFSGFFIHLLCLFIPFFFPFFLIVFKFHVLDESSIHTGQLQTIRILVDFFFQ